MDNRPLKRFSGYYIFILSRQNSPVVNGYSRCPCAYIRKNILWMDMSSKLHIRTFDIIHDRLKVKRIFNPSPSAKPRYAIMILLLISAPLLGFPIANLISAPGIISVQISKYFYEGIVGIELGLIGIIVISEVFIIRRGWCNYICPVGSFLGILRFKRTMKVIYTEDTEHTCGRCMECVTACQLGLNPMTGKIYPLCHNCGDCIAVCER